MLIIKFCHLNELLLTTENACRALITSSPPPPKKPDYGGMDSWMDWGSDKDNQKCNKLSLTLSLSLSIAMSDNTSKAAFC